MNSPGSAEIIHLKSESDFKTILSQSTVPVIVDFHAEWCGPCKRLAPIIKEKIKSLNVKLVTVDVDDFPDLAEAQNVGGIPHVILFKNGILVKYFVGCDLASLDDMIKYISS